MSKIIQALEAEQMVGKNIPDFSAGDTVEVKIRVKEGSRERLQIFTGIVIAKRNRGMNSAFTVRKISHGEGVERVFQTYSYTIHSINVKRRGKVRRAKLYYLRERQGRAARIQEKLTRSGTTSTTESTSTSTPTPTPESAPTPTQTATSAPTEPPTPTPTPESASTPTSSEATSEPTPTPTPTTEAPSPDTESSAEDPGSSTTTSES